MDCAYCGEELPDNDENLTYESGIGTVYWHKDCGGTVVASGNDQYEQGDKF